MEAVKIQSADSYIQILLLILMVGNLPVNSEKAAEKMIVIFSILANQGREEILLPLSLHQVLQS